MKNCRVLSLLLCRSFVRKYSDNKYVKKENEGLFNLFKEKEIVHIINDYKYQIEEITISGEYFSYIKLEDNMKSLVYLKDIREKNRDNVNFIYDILYEEKLFYEVLRILHNFKEMYKRQILLRDLRIYYCLRNNLFHTELPLFELFLDWDIIIGCVKHSRAFNSLCHRQLLLNDLRKKIKE